MVGEIQESSFWSKIGLLKPLQNQKILGKNGLRMLEWKLENLDWVLALRRYIHKLTLSSLAFEVGTVIIICIFQMEVLDKLPKATQLG